MVDNQFGLLQDQHLQVAQLQLSVVAEVQVDQEWDQDHKEKLEALQAEAQEEADQQVHKIQIPEPESVMEMSAVAAAWQELAVAAELAVQEELLALVV